MYSFHVRGLREAVMEYVPPKLHKTWRLKVTTSILSDQCDCFLSEHIWFEEENYYP